MRLVRGLLTGVIFAFAFVAVSSSFGSGCATSHRVVPAETAIADLTVTDDKVPSATLIDSLMTGDVVVMHRLITLAASRGVDRVVYVINTSGGPTILVQEIESIINLAHRRNIKVDCVVDGMGWSAGFYLLQQCDRRYMTRSSTLMTHEPHFVPRDTADGGASDAQPDEGRMVEVLTSAFEEGARRRLKVSASEYHQRVTGGRMWWMTWQDALKAGAVDGVVEDPNEIVKGRP